MLELSDAMDRLGVELNDDVAGIHTYVIGKRIRNYTQHPEL
ncbi:MAG: hypothetical protein ACRD1C_06910 [Terriglobales bacterium]